MGLFSSKKKTVVDTAIVRVVEDEMIPNSVQTGVVESIFETRPLVASIQLAVLNGPFRKFERMYRYGRRGDYFYGLPDARLLTSADGDDEAKAAIEAEVGEPITIDYVYFRPLNHVHEGRRHITENHGYDHETNELTGLSAQKGFPVYLKDLVATYQADPDRPADPLARGVWGDSPRSGQTADRPARSPEVGLGHLTVEQSWRESENETDGVEIQYTWEDDERASHEESIFLDLSHYDDDTEYYQARYTVQGQVHYWTYSPDEGRHPDLDGVYDPEYGDPGTYFPFALFRHHKQDRTADGLEDTEEFKSTEKLLSFIDIDFKSLGEQIHENPDIHDVEQAALVMAVSANTEDPVEIDYLFRFWSNLAENTPHMDEARFYYPLDLNYGGQPNYAVEIADADFKMVISYVGIKRRIKPGVIGSVGDFTNTMEDKPVPGATLFGIPAGSSRRRYYRKQITSSMYDEIEVIDPVMRYDIYAGKGALGAADDERLLVPLDYEICRQMKITDREWLYYRSLHLVCNSRVTEKVRWYERGVFKWALVIAAIVITVISLGSTWTALSTAITAATTVTAAVIAVLQILLKAILVNLAMDVLVEILGPEFAFFTAVVAAVWGGARAIQAGGAGQDVWANRLLQASTGLTNAVQREMDDMMEALTNEAAEFADMAQAKWEELEEVNDLLNSRQLLNPFTFVGQEPLMIYGEGPDDYFNRTVHAGNPGPMSMDIVENYVEASLELPDVHSSLGKLA